MRTLLVAALLSALAWPAGEAMAQKRKEPRQEARYSSGFMISRRGDSEGLVFGKRYPHPPPRVYRATLEAMLRLGMQPRMLLLDEAIATHPHVRESGGYALEMAIQPALLDSTQLLIDALPLQPDGRGTPIRAAGEDALRLALFAATMLMAKVDTLLEAVGPEEHTPADSLRDAGAYGYSRANPVKVGGGVDRGVQNQLRYLASLRGPGGERVEYFRLGSCCRFATPASPDGSARLDAYEVRYPGLAKAVVLYLNLYDHEEPRAPEGFTLAPEPAGAAETRAAALP